MRTLNATLESALANQQGELILRVNTWTDAADYNANPATPDHVWTCKAFSIESTTASADLVTENDYTLSAFTVFTIERGVRLSGVDYTTESGLMHVRKYKEDYGTISITGSSYPNQKINIAAGDGTYQEVIEAFCTDIGKTAVFKNATDAWLSYQFLPTGKALSLNKAELFENLLKQKYCILVYEESPNNLVFYNQDSYQSSALNALTENAGALLAVATAGANGGMTSVTGADWIPQILPSFYNDVTYAAGLYVAVGASVCATSADGITWTARTIPAGTYTSLTYGNSLFVAVGTNVCATSVDGITWTARTIGAGAWTSVIWTGSYFISASSEATEKLAYSTNGIDWIVGNPWSAQTAAEANEWEGLCWSPELSLFCAVAVNGTNQVQTSPDGINWTARSASSSKLWTSVCWSPELSLFCAVSRDVGTSGIMTSPDGITWTDRTPAETNTWQSVTWSPALGLFCAVSNSGTNHVMTSPDGTNWTARASTRNFTGVCWSPELTLFVAVGNNAATSPDGITWTNRTAATPLSAVCWSPDLTLFVAVGSNLCYTSPDGTTWTSRTPAEANDWNSVTWSPERDLFVAVSNNGTNQIMKSSNGTSWTSQAEVEAVPWLDVTWSPAIGLFCAVATSGTNRVMLWNGGNYPNSIMAITQSSNLRVAVGTSVCYTSTNGTSWTSRTIPAGTYYGVTYGNSLYVAVGASVVATSTDGTTWTARTPAALNTWRDVIYSSTLALFIAVASDGASRTMTSADGITWTASTANADFDLSYLDGPTSYLDRQQSEVHFIWRDEAATVHTSGDTSLPQWNLGFLTSTDSPPTTRADAYYKIFLQKAPVRLDITDGDKVHFSPYWSIDPTQTIDAMMQITEHLNLTKSPAWYQEIRSIVLFDKTEGGALPSTIERVAAYTPLVSTGFDGNLTPAVNNLQALAQAVDDMTLGAAPATTAADDFQVGNGSGNWIKKTLAQTITILRTSLDAIFAPIAKGVTNGDSHDHAGGDGAAITDANLSTSDITTNNASASKHGFLKKLSNVATEFMDGTGAWSTPVASGGVTPYTNTANLYRHTNATATTRFDALINGAPTNAANSVVTFDTVTAGNVTSITPNATGQLAQMRLYNTTRGNYALIVSATGATVTLDRNVTTLGSPWADNDVITNYQTTIGTGSVAYAELEIVDATLLSKSALILETSCRSATAGELLSLHPYATYAVSKEQNTTALVTGLTTTRTVFIPLTSNVIGIGWQGTAYTAMIIKVEGYIP